MEITKNAAVLNAKVIEASGWDDLKAYAEKNIATNDIQCLAYTAYAIGVLAGNGNEDACKAFKRICDYVYDESSFSDEEIWAFHQFID